MPEIVALLPALEELTALAASRKSEIGLTVTWSQAGADVVVTGGKPLDGPLRATLAGFVGRVGLARLTCEDDLIAEARPPRHDMGGAAVVPPPGAFLQATSAGEAALRKAVVQAVGDARRVVDLFSGCGTFALPLAKVAEVHAVEASDAMLRALDAAWRKAVGMKRLTTETRDLFRRPLLPQDLKGFDAAVIDPPRAGAEVQVAELAQSTVNRIAAVSCNPVSFARDAKTLIDAGFSLNWIDVVDQFRWSSHVELAAQFTRDHMHAQTWRMGST